MVYCIIAYTILPLLRSITNVINTDKWVCTVPLYVIQFQLPITFTTTDKTNDYVHYSKACKGDDLSKEIIDPLTLLIV